MRLVVLVLCSRSCSLLLSMLRTIRGFSLALPGSGSQGTQETACSTRGELGGDISPWGTGKVSL